MRDGDAIAEVCTGKNQLVYMSPESLLTMEGYAFRPRVPGASSRTVGLVIDSVKKWFVLLSGSIISLNFTSIFNRGETFRNEFLSIGEARSLVPDNVRMMALTATATQTTRQQALWNG